MQENNVKTNLKGKGWQSVEWNQLDQGRVERRAPVTTLMEPSAA